jgi:XTP/dITP diphosphohydrolase
VINNIFSGDKILIATRNKGKIREIQGLLKELPLTVLSLDDLGLDDEVEENGDSFLANAILKARHFFRVTGIPTLADDSGLCVDAMSGLPGVYSARYGGKELTDEQRCRLIIANMVSVPEEKRTAHFECAMILAMPEDTNYVFLGECPGILLLNQRGENGFGYDPIFFYTPAQKTFAEMSQEEKSKVSHRGKALKQLVDFLQGVMF